MSPCRKSIHHIFIPIQAKPPFLDCLPFSVGVYPSQLLPLYKTVLLAISEKVSWDASWGVCASHTITQTFVAVG